MSILLSMDASTKLTADLSRVEIIGSLIKKGVAMPENLQGIESNFIESWEDWDGDGGCLNFYGIQLKESTRELLGQSAKRVNSLCVDCEHSVVVFYGTEEKSPAISFKMKVILEPIEGSDENN